MQIVIDIPESAYIGCKAVREIQDDESIDIILDVASVFDVVANGTVIPEEHGRLIDQNILEKAIYDYFESIQCYDGSGIDICKEIENEILRELPTVLE